MYVTAHRAETPEGTTGVNSYLFLHFEDPLPLLRPDEPDVAYIAQFAPGTCVAEKEDVQPGGNTVKCSLDVAGPDDARAVAVRRVLDQLGAQLAGRLPPVRMSSEGIAASFNATLDFDDDRPGLLAALDELSVRVVATLGLRSRARRPSGPLVVWLRARAEGIELSLPSATRARLGSNLAHRMKALLPSEVVQHFPGQGPEALLQTALVLTQRNEDQIRRAGGLVFVDPTSEAEVLRWPQARSPSPESSRPARKQTRRNAPRR